MASQHYQSHSCVPVVCTGFVQGAKNQNSRAILARLWFAQGLYRGCTRRQKSKQQINSHCCQLHLQGLHVYGLKKCHLPLFSPPRLSEKSRRELKRMYPTTGETTNFQSSEGVLLLLRQSPPYRSICVAHVFSKTTFSSGLMITELKSNTKTTGWNKRPGASPTLTTRRNSPGTSRESIANQKDF